MVRGFAALVLFHGRVLRARDRRKRVAMSKDGDWIPLRVGQAREAHASVTDAAAGLPSAATPKRQ